MNLLNLNSILNNWWWVIPLVICFAIGRYFLFAGMAYLVCYRSGFKFLNRFKIQSRSPRRDQIIHELLYSLSTACVFSLMGLLVYFLYIKGYTTIYTHVEQHELLYLISSLLLMVFVHDTYFYWTHRLLHTRWFLKKIHSVHHRSTNPTPWAAYSFHPLEAFLEGSFIFPLVTIFPVYINVLLFFTFLILLLNIIGHMGYEFIPKKIRESTIGQFFTSSTHHNQHHQKGNRNFGYYFTIWDKMMRTLQK